MTRFLRVWVLGHDVRVAVRPAPPPPRVFYTGKDDVADPDEWLRDAETSGGTWLDRDGGLAQRALRRPQAAPTQLGGHAWPSWVEAPGTYVFDT